MWISGNLIINQCTSKKIRGNMGSGELVACFILVFLMCLIKPCFYSCESKQSIHHYQNTAIHWLYIHSLHYRWQMLCFVVHVLKNLIIHVLPLIFRHGKAPNALWRIPALSDSPTPQWATLWGHALPHRQSTLPRRQPSVPTHGKHALSTKQCSLP